DFTLGFETILEEGITTGIYDVHNSLQEYVTPLRLRMHIHRQSLSAI
ncbi:hypothetical protein AZE42_14198, partial [Rhizopogon vesiculosus]